MSGQWEGNKLYYRNEIQKQYEYKFKLIIWIYLYTDLIPIWLLRKCSKKKKNLLGFSFAKSKQQINHFRKKKNSLSSFEIGNIKLQIWRPKELAGKNQNNNEKLRKRTRNWKKRRKRSESRMPCFSSKRLFRRDSSFRLYLSNNNKIINNKSRYFFTFNFTLKSFVISL